MNIYYYKKIHLDIPGFWKEIIRLTIPMAAAFCCCYAISRWIGGNGVGYILTNALIYTAVYIPMIWFFGMNGYERALFVYPLKRLRRES
jgi:hypothetical protein